MSSIKLALISCGLGNVHRGFEVSTARLYKALAKTDGMDVRLFSGAKYADATPIWNIPRDQVVKYLLGPLSHINDRRCWEFSYGVEQISFALSILPEILKWRPDVVWTKEVPFAYFLLYYRQLFNLKLKVIFANGGAFRPQTYKDFDFIQHLQNDSFTDAIAFGIPQEKMVTLTNFLDFHKSEKPRSLLRSQLGYRDTDWVVISVAAWNRHHKRIDYLIDEVARLGDDNVKLLLCGHPEPETPILKQLAQEKMPGRVQWLTVGEKEVHEALQAADAFVLPSLNEGLGNAMVEAAIAGLPVVSHRHGASNFLLRDPEKMTDLSQPGNLAERLRQIKSSPPDQDELDMLQARALDLFSREALLPRYLDMVRSVAQLPPPAATSTGSSRNYDLRTEN